MWWKIKTKVLQTIGLLFILNSIAGVFLYYRPMAKEVLYKGKVVFHSSVKHEIKNGQATELYLGVDFDNGYKKSIMVDVNTFYRNADGKRIAFKFNDDYFKPKTFSLKEALISAFLLITFFIDIMFLALSLVFL